MKKIYWRPKRVSRIELSLVALLALGGYVLLESWREPRASPYYEEKLQAAQLARRAMVALKGERQRRKIPVQSDADPGDTGMIGYLVSSVTSTPGNLPSKQTSVNPNFSAVILEYLKEAGVGRGDLVAVGVSGSFPALNVAVYAALQTLRAKPVVIASASGSQWGANIPGWLWIHQEQYLFERRFFSFRSVAASRGGIGDRAYGMEPDAIKLLDSEVTRLGLRLLEPRQFIDAIEMRMQVFEERAKGNRYRAYINVGGGAASVGTSLGKKLFQPGLNSRPPRGALSVDSVMVRFARLGVPIIHLVEVDLLAKLEGLPLAPKTMPEVGQGKVYVTREYRRWLAATLLVLIFGVLFAFVRLDWGFRILHTGKKAGGDDDRPEQMV